MANRKVVLLRYCKTEKGWRRYPAAIGRNGRVRPQYIVPAGEHHHYPEGHYELRSYQGSKAVYKNVRVNAADALQARDREAQLLIARDAAVSGGSGWWRRRGAYPCLGKLSSSFKQPRIGAR